MQLSKRGGWVLAGVSVGCLILVAASSVFFQPSLPPRESIAGKTKPQDSKRIAPPPQLGPGRALIGGIERPATDVQPPRDKLAGNSERQPPKKRQGFSPAVNPEANPQTKLVATALKQKTAPERYNSFVVPRNFDAEAFAENPEQYANEFAAIVEPGRVFAPAQPGESTPRIRSGGKRFHRVTQGESVRLSVKASPFAPVSMASQDLGQFDNELTSITVVADESGVASANYTASGGTIDEVQILAASPAASGQIAFTISVQIPE